MSEWVGGRYESSSRKSNKMPMYPPFLARAHDLLCSSQDCDEGSTNDASGTEVDCCTGLSCIGGGGAGSAASTVGRCGAAAPGSAVATAGRRAGSKKRT